MLQSLYGEIYVVPLDGERVRRLEGFGNDVHIEAMGFSPSGRFAAAAPLSGPDHTKQLRLWDLERSETKVFDLPAADPDSEAGDSIRDRGVMDLWFEDETTLYTAGDGGLRRWELETGAFETIVPAAKQMTAVASADGMKVLALTGEFGGAGRVALSFHHLTTGESISLSGLGWDAQEGGIAIDPSGKIVAAAGGDGFIRVGDPRGGEPHLLPAGTGVESVAISSDLRWVASAGADGTLRLWPMPDLSKPPIHTLPQDQLVAKLKSLTNLRAVRDEQDATGWSIDVGPFPGWRDVPTW
jgi:WD40 repeat protein